jgi:hypothetical protein
MQRRIQVKLRGGLGNQLYIFVATWVISKELGLPIRVNGRFLAWTGSNANRKMELNNFVWPKLGSKKIIFVRSSKLLPKPPLFKKIVLKGLDLINETLTKKPIPVSSWENYEEIKDYARSKRKIEGHFLNLKWLMRAFELDFPSRLVLKNRSENEPPMFKSEFCAIHVRLTDYLMAPTIFPTLSEEYYLRAVEDMKSFGISKFVVFTDDPIELVKRYPQLNSKSTVITADRNLTVAESFFWMHRAAAIITANSTFSIFAAGFVWRNGGFVITPNVRTFLDEKEELWIPQDWIKLDYQTGKAIKH